MGVRKQGEQDIRKITKLGKETRKMANKNVRKLTKLGDRQSRESN